MSLVSCFWDPQSPFLGHRTPVVAGLSRPREPRRESPDVFRGEWILVMEGEDSEQTQQRLYVQFAGARSGGHGSSQSFFISGHHCFVCVSHSLVRSACGGKSKNQRLYAPTNSGGRDEKRLSHFPHFLSFLISLSSFPLFVFWFPNELRGGINYL